MYKRRFFLPLFSLLIILSLGFIFLSTKTNIFSGGIQILFSPFQRLFFSSTNIIAQNKKSKNIQNNVIESAQNLIATKKLQQENTALRDQFQTSEISSSKLLPADIVGEPNFIPNVTFPEYLIINRGLLDHVHTGSAVVYKNILIGNISQVTNRFSQITLLSNNSISFPVKTVGTGALGILKGQGDGNLLLNNVVLSDHLDLNDIVTTYGNQDVRGNGFPPDLVIGKIVSVEKNPSALFQQASIQPLIDVTKLDMVFVLTQ